MIFTTIQAGPEVHTVFLHNLRLLAKFTNDKVYCLLQQGYDGTNEILLPSGCSNEFENTDDICTSECNYMPHQNPFVGETSRTRFRIFPSIRQHLKTICGIDGARFLVSTGACTYADYDTNKKSHVQGFKNYSLGAVVITNGKYRNIRAFDDGSFYDLGYYYHNNRRFAHKQSILVAGDIHTCSTDKDQLQFLREMIKRHNVQSIFLHDIFDGMSVNHHTNGQPLLKLQTHITLSQELAHVKSLLMEFSKLCTVYVVKSNHDEFLNKYLATGTYEPHNLKMAFELGNAFMNGRDPLYAALGKINNVKYLSRNDMVIKNYCRLDLHGDKGTNGAKGRIEQFDRMAFRSVLGHSHTPGLLTYATQVGTSTKLRLSYNSGPSSWAHAHALVHKNYTQLLIT